MKLSHTCMQRGDKAAADACAAPTHCLPACVPACSACRSSFVQAVLIPELPPNRPLLSDKLMCNASTQHAALTFIARTKAKAQQALWVCSAESHPPSASNEVGMCCPRVHKQPDRATMCDRARLHLSTVFVSYCLEEKQQASLTARGAANARLEVAASMTDRHRHIHPRTKHRTLPGGHTHTHQLTHIPKHRVDQNSPQADRAAATLGLPASSCHPTDPTHSGHTAAASSSSSMGKV